MHVKQFLAAKMLLCLNSATSVVDSGLMVIELSNHKPLHIPQT